MKLYLIICITFIPITMIAQKNQRFKDSKVDYSGFEKLIVEAREYRKQRLIPFNEFLMYMEDENTILLDTRSEAAYIQKHIKGALHLNFSDFTEEKIAEIIPSKDTRILIYCNNNIQGDPINFATKKLSLALNIPTFINLYGYGYKNIYELSSLVPVSFTELEFEGTSTN